MMKKKKQPKIVVNLIVDHEVIKREIFADLMKGVQKVKASKGA
jgi:hypothetical protein